MARIDGSDRGALVSIESVRRLNKALQKYEQGNRNISAPRLRTAFDDPLPIRIGRTTEDWSKGTTQDVELIYENECGVGDCGSSSGSGSGGGTLEAINLSYDVAANTDVILASAKNGCWYMIEAADCPCEDESSGSGSGECGCMSLGGQDLTKLPGYDESKVQVLSHDGGCLQWLDTTDCEES